jgi:histone acetyltransferase (RNA polymerase elongator complex component)
MSKTNFTIPIFIPELSCNNKCIYCNQQKITNIHQIPSPEQVKTIIKERLNLFPPSAENIQIAFFGGNFTGIDKNLQTEYLQSAQYFIDNEKVKSIRISTRPDYINKESLSVLSSFSVKNIELGVQSMCDNVLLYSGRGHNAETTIKATEMIIHSGFEAGLQMMIGLPADTKEKSLMTAQEIVKLGASETRIYPVLVFKDTPLYKLFLEGKYNPLSLEETVETATPIVETFEKAGVKILRIGLHPSDFLHNGQMVAGPWHPALSQMIYTNVWNSIIAKISQQFKKCFIHVSTAQYSNATGFKRSNSIEFPEIKVISDNTLSGMNYEIHHS